MTNQILDPRATRRGVLALMAGAGAGGALAACSQPAPVRPEGLSAQTLACAETLSGVAYTPAEREQMLTGLEAWQARAERLRALEKPNGLHPGLIFEPRLPGRAFREQANAVTGLPADPGPLPSDPVDIAYAPVWRLAGWMTRGAITSAQLTELYLARITAHADQLECFVHVSADRARAEAAARDSERAAGQVRGPLHGVPYALKDIIDVEDLPATWGASVYADRIGSETAVIARRLEAAGAVLLGKATSGAIAYGDI